MNPLIQAKTTPSLLTSLAFLCFALLPKAQAVIPPPDGGYPGFNTAEGQNALFGRTTGVANTGVGWHSLFSNTDGSYNTGVGAGTLLFNVGDQTTGEGTQNTAIGTGALLFNTTAFNNTAEGAFALFSNTAGNFNTAVGTQALFNNTIGGVNTGIGNAALGNNTTGAFNVALGDNAGGGVTTANEVICIGTAVAGENVSNSCYIGSIFGETSASGAAVYVNSSHKLGTLTSSSRFKDDIKPMERLSEALFALKPVSFHYKKEIDPAGMQQFGLVAEDVDKINPDLVVRDKEGKPYSVRYEQVNAMLLNEFLKEHKAFVEEQHKVKKLEATVVGLAATVKEQAAPIRKVSAQIEVSKATPNMALSSP
jgi:trimeric autotransporter adhesin